MRFNKKGFTLIELIIVIVIIGVLASIAAPMMQGVKAKAMCAEIVTAMGTVRTAVRQYYTEYDALPSWSGMYLDYGQAYSMFLKAGLDINQLKMLYGSRYDYSVTVSVSNGISGYIMYQPSIYSDAPKASEAMNILNPAGGAYLWMDLADGKIYQNGMPQSGYPQRTTP